MIKDLAELRKLMTLCRSKGVDEITLEGMTIKFGEMPARQGKDEADDEQTQDPNIDSATGLTFEELAFLSVRPQGGEQ